MIFSVPHRLLAIALRRDILVGINTIDELFNGRFQNILIKDEFKDKPVLVSSISKGTGVDLADPMRATSLTSYLKLRGKQIGCPDGKFIHASLFHH